MTPVTLLAWFSVSQESANKPEEAVKSSIIRLDVMGKRGAVSFDHKAHETRMNLEPDYRYKAKPGAACSGCHHTTNQVGVLQLWRCSSCHREDGNSLNPRNAEFDELRSERAFHNQCIGCHRASAKGPLTCGGCHASLARGGFH